MDGRGGCCIARYTGGEAYDNYMSKVNRIMLKFRPIAPKPATDGGSSGSGGSSSENSDYKHVKPVRGKRKYVRRTSNIKRCNNSKKKKLVSSTETSSGGGDDLVTLPLLPETPERKDSPSHDLSFTGRKGKGSSSTTSSAPIWLRFDKQSVTKGYVRTGNVDQKAVVVPQPVKVMGTFVTVECVTDTWVDGNGIGCTDAERMMMLEADTCPGFVSDGKNCRVWWTNKAYGEMAGQVDGEEVMVWVVMKEGVAVPVTYPAFTCKVRVTCGKESRSAPLTVPCDVWRMDNGGYAWRLDVKAALSLGR